MNSSKKRPEALKIQISFHQKDLGQTHEDKTVVYFCHIHKALTETELKLNLVKLLPPSTSFLEQ